MVARLVSQQEAADTHSLMRTQRNALLMQVRWIEDHGDGVADPKMKDFFVAQRRASLEIVREIERQLGIKPKRRIMRRVK